MVQDFAGAAYAWWLGFLDVVRQLLPLLLASSLAAGALWLAYRRLDPEDAIKWRENVGKWRPLLRRFGTIFCTVALLCGLLVQSHKIIAQRRQTLQQAEASRRNEPQLSGVTQYAPSVAFIQDKTYTRTLTLPPDFVKNIGEAGVQVLSPYLTDPSTADVLKLVDTFRRSGQDVVFTRELTRRDEVPVPADSAEVTANFRKEGSTSGGTHFSTDFVGAYRFHNPEAKPMTMRFNFPPPQGGGTTQGFYFTVGNQRVTEPDEHGLYVWEGVVPPKSAVSAEAHYTITGGGAYLYLLGSSRRRIGDFHMAVSSASPVRFSRTGIFPTSVSGNRAEWSLRDVLTEQSIYLVFPRTDAAAELLDKTLSWLPLVLVVFAVAALLLGLAVAAWGTVAVGLSLLAIPVLSSYMGPSSATVIGGVLVVIAAGVVSRTITGWLLGIAAAILACAFLTGEHGALTAWVVCVVSLIAVVFRKRISHRSPMNV